MSKKIIENYNTLLRESRALAFHFRSNSSCLLCQSKIKYHLLTYDLSIHRCVMRKSIDSSRSIFMKCNVKPAMDNRDSRVYVDRMYILNILYQKYNNEENIVPFYLNTRVTKTNCTSLLSETLM